MCQRIKNVIVCARTSFVPPQMLLFHTKQAEVKPKGECLGVDKNEMCRPLICLQQSCCQLCLYYSGNATLKLMMQSLLITMAIQGTWAALMAFYAHLHVLLPWWLCQPCSRSMTYVGEMFLCRVCVMGILPSGISRGVNVMTCSGAMHH